MNKYLEAQKKIAYVKEYKLTHLDLSFLYLSELPDELEELDFLYSLDLSYNYLTKLPDYFSKFKNLVELDLSNNSLNGLISLPFLLESSLNIKELNIENNNLIIFPEEILNLPALELLEADNNPFVDNIPPEIWEAGLNHAYNFLNSIALSKNTVELYETKLIFVGDGDVGKTTLMKKIIDPFFRVEVGKEPTTHGININKWLIECPKVLSEYQIYTTHRHLLNDYLAGTNEDLEYVYDVDIDEDAMYENSMFNFKVEIPVDLNVWDFGGQDIYLSTHHFFLTKRSIYIFVWEARKHNDYYNFEKWLNTIKLLGQESPVYIVMNKSDVFSHGIDEMALKNKYPNITGFFQVSCLKNIGIKNIRRSIKETIPTLPHIGSLLPKVWVDLKKALQKDTRNYISYSEYISICSKLGLDETQANYISEYLHDLGIILHFQKDRFLENLVILKPHWVTEAVYKLIDNKSVEKDKGRFNFNTLRNCLDYKIYPRDTHEVIVKLIEKFEICFNILGTDEFILPARLPITPSNIFDTFELRLDYEYSIFPSGILTRLICRLHHFIDKKTFSKNWFELKYEKTNAIVLEDNFSKKISIFIKGHQISETLAIIRSNLEQIHKALNLTIEKDFSEKIPCNCFSCIKSSNPHLFLYEVLKRYVEKNKEKIDCPISIEEVDITELLKKY